MPTRRDIIKAGLYAAGAAGAAGASMFPNQLFANAGQAKPLAGQAPMRFIFIHKGNGLLPDTLVPPSFDEATQQKEKSKEAYTVDLDGHTLPDWMEPLASHQQNLTILQGLSGKMCTTGHHTWCSSLGAFKANERLSSIKWATVDFELAKLFPSPFEHIELACFPTGGGNSRGNIEGIEKGFSAPRPATAQLRVRLGRRSRCRSCSSRSRKTTPPRRCTRWTARSSSSSRVITRRSPSRWTALST